MWTHETAQLGAVMVGTHKQLTLVFVATGVASCWLRRRRQPLKVEFVCVPLAVHFGHDILIVVVSVTKS